MGVALVSVPAVAAAHKAAASQPLSDSFSASIFLPNAIPIPPFCFRITHGWLPPDGPVSSLGQINRTENHMDRQESVFKCSSLPQHGRVPFLELLSRRLSGENVFSPESDR